MMRFQCTPTTCACMTLILAGVALAMAQAGANATQSGFNDEAQADQAAAAKHPSCVGAEDAAKKFVEDTFFPSRSEDFFRTTWESTPTVLKGGRLDLAELFPYVRLEQILASDSTLPERLNAGTPMLLGENVVSVCVGVDGGVGVSGRCTCRSSLSAAQADSCRVAHA